MIKKVLLLTGLALVIATSFPAQSQTLPGPADVGRIQPEEKIVIPNRSDDEKIVISNTTVQDTAPEGAKTIRFVLQNVSIEDETVFTPVQLAELYAPYIGKEVSLDIAWNLASRVTERYRNAGYFLSRAYVPQQQISDGKIIIKVIEGYIGKVDLPPDVQNLRIIRYYIDGLVAQQPIQAATVESFLLRLNDLPGFSFRAILSPLEEKQPGDAAVKLTLLPTEKDAVGSINFDNFSSRFLGPNEFSGSFSKSFLPLQQTTVSGLNSAPFDRLHYGFLDQTIIIAPNVTLDINASVTHARPGYTLTQFDIDSQASYESASISYQLIRQRDENLVFKTTLDFRDVTSDILGAPLTRDRIRTWRAGATYDFTDDWQGLNVFNLTLSHGINGLGSTQKNDPYLSRAGADPNFSKAELSISRLQSLTDDWSLFAALYGQSASGVLFSSEQFGYGGQSFGRAFDSSELTGDAGVNESIELRYNALAQLKPVNLQPYTFYDRGTVWNSAINQPKRLTGQSAGLGLRLSSIYNEFANFGVAWPLDRDVETPIYGTSHHGPRILLQIGQQF